VKLLSKDSIIQCLKDLALRRPVFHSEADFQFEFAWELRRDGILTRLEVPVNGVGEVDLVIPVQKNSGQEYFIEFKYKTKIFHHVIDGESFHLKGHAAHPLGRYDFMKDMERIQRSGNLGWAIFLTNDSPYWEAGDEGNGAAFCLREGRVIYGNLAWGDNTKTNSIGKRRISPIRLDGITVCSWEDYSCVNNERFRYLVAEFPAE
jgi:hypothetical protein